MVPCEARCWWKHSTNWWTTGEITRRHMEWSKTSSFIRHLWDCWGQGSCPWNLLSIITGLVFKRRWSRSFSYDSSTDSSGTFLGTRSTSICSPPWNCWVSIGLYTEKTLLFFFQYIALYNIQQTFQPKALDFQGLLHFQVVSTRFVWLQKQTSENAKKHRHASHRSLKDVPSAGAGPRVFWSSIPLYLVAKMVVIVTNYISSLITIVNPP